LNGQVSGNNCLSAIRFRGGLVWQVSCYTLLTRIPTSMATVLLSTPNRTLFRFIGRLEQIRSSPAYLENVRLSPSSPVLLTRNGPLRIFDTFLITFLSYTFVVLFVCFVFIIYVCVNYVATFKLRKVYANRTDLKFERRPRSC